MSVFERAETDEHAGRGALEGHERNSRVIEGLASHFEKESLLRVHDVGFAGRDPEEVRVEALDVVQEGAPARGTCQHFRGLRRPVVEELPAFVRDLTHRVRTCEQCLPEGVRPVDAAG
ncbi:hypothetical protein SALBM311S_02925 [Streptomyces alboniger]